MIYTSIVMGVVVRTIQKTTRAAHATDARRIAIDAAIQGILYCSAFLLSWIFGTINRLYELFGTGENGATAQSPLLIWLHTFFVPLQGFFNALAYARPYYNAWRERNNHSGSRLGCVPGSVWDYIKRGMRRSWLFITTCDTKVLDDDARKEESQSEKSSEIVKSTPSHAPALVVALNHNDGASANRMSVS